jgi:hypothetical protein
VAIADIFTAGMDDLKTIQAVQPERAMAIEKR